jgi:hypothetical protein
MCPPNPTPRLQTWNASPEGPDSLSAALAAARLAGGGSARRIILRGGTYFLAEPLVLQAPDSGLTLEAAPGEEVTLCGGRRLSDWRPDGDGLWAAPAPGAASREWDFRVLAVNGRFCPRARWPHQGRLQHLTKCEVPWIQNFEYIGFERPPTEQELSTLRYRAGDLPAGLDFNNAELDVFHSWDESLVGVLTHEEATQTLTFRNPASYVPGVFDVYDYVVYNVREGLSEPGQWYLDRTRGLVVYWPLPGEDLTQAEALAPRLGCLVSVEGTEASPVTGVTLRGLHFSLANAPLVAAGGLANLLPGALALHHAHDCRLESVEISLVAGHGVKAENCVGLQVTGSQIHHTGGSGLSLQGKGFCVEDCHVHHVGLVHPSALGIFAGGTGGHNQTQSEHHVISHNEVHDTPYSGMVIYGTDHLVEGNLLHKIMGVMTDGAAIYVAGAQRCVLRGNRVYDLSGARGSSQHPDWAYAYYLDIDAQDCLVEGNLAEDVPVPMLLHMSQRNTIRHNVCTSQTSCYVNFTLSTDCRMIGNVFYARGKMRVYHPEGVALWENNVMFSGTGEFEERLSWDGTEVGPWTLPAGITVADPGFVEAEQSDFRFAPDSAALAFGIPQLDVSGAGRRTKT